jgi:hypothetical protein
VLIARPSTARTDNAPKVRFSATLGEGPEIEVLLEKKATNYLGLVKAACILLWYRRLCEESGGGRSRTAI